MRSDTWHLAQAISSNRDTPPLRFLNLSFFSFNDSARTGAVLTAPSDNSADNEGKCRWP